MDKLRFTALILVLLIIGCASIKDRNQMSLFDQTARAYDRAIRWGNYGEAYAFKKLSDTSVKLPNFDEYRQNRVTDYQVKNTIISKSKLKIVRLVDIHYYRTNNVIVKVISDRQEWEYNEEEGRWYLMSELPKFE